MKYFKSLVFDAGLVLIIAAIVAGLRPQMVAHAAAQYGWFTVSAEEYDLRLPLGLGLTGVIATIIGATRVGKRE